MPEEQQIPTLTDYCTTAIAIAKYLTSKLSSNGLADSVSIRSDLRHFMGLEDRYIWPTIGHMQHRHLIRTSGTPPRFGIAPTDMGREYANMLDFQVAAHELACWAEENDQRDINVEKLPAHLNGDPDLIEQAIEVFENTNVLKIAHRNGQTQRYDRFIFSHHLRSITKQPELLVFGKPVMNNVTINHNPTIANVVNSPGGTATAASGSAKIEQCISVRIETVSQNNPEVAAALKAVADAISTSKTLEQTRQAEARELLLAIAEQCSKPKQERQSPALSKGIAAGMRELLSLSADVLQVWTTCWPTIAPMLGVVLPG